MKRLTHILLNICLLVAMSKIAPAQSGTQGQLISFQVGDLFNQRNPRDLIRDENGIVWILTSSELYYLVDDGVYRYEGFGDEAVSHLEFLPSNSNGVYVVDRRSISKISSPLEKPDTHDLSELASTEESMMIQDSDFNEEGKLIVLTGIKEKKRLWEYDLHTRKYDLLCDSASHVWDTEVVEGGYLLIGQTIRYLWEEETGYRGEEIYPSHLFDSSDTRMDLAYTLDDKVYFYTDGGKALYHDILKRETYLLPFAEPIELLFKGKNGPLALSQTSEILSLNTADEGAYAKLNSELKQETGVPLGNGSIVYTDRNGDLWLSGKDGILHWTEVKPLFELTKVESTGRVTNVHIDPLRDKRYLLSANAGINIYRNSTGELIRQIKTDAKGRKIEGFKWRLLDGELYIYALNSFNRLDKDTDELEFLVDPFLADGTVLGNRLNTFEVSNKHGLIFLGTKNNHLICYNPQDGSERVIPVIQDGPYDLANLIYEISELPDGNLLVLGALDLFHVSVPNLEVTLARDHWKQIPKLERDVYSGLRIIDNGKLVLSTFGQGLHILDLDKDSVYRPNHDGFPKAEISDIFWDQQEYIYGASKKGLLSYHIPSNTIRLLDLKPVLSNPNIYYRYMNSDSPGEMHLGIMDGYVSFNSSVVNSAKQKESFLRSLAINGAPFLFDNSVESDSEISLDYTQNFVSAQLSNPIDPGSSESAVMYRLKGLHEDWRLHLHEGELRYEAIPPGEYALELKNVNSTQPRSLLHIDIDPPFWKTTWFILSAIALLTILIIGIYRLRSGYIRRELELREQYKLEMAQLEMKSLRAQMNPHFLFNSLNSIKSFIAQNEPRIATRYLTKFSHLIRLILNNSRDSMVSLDQELKALELYVELEQLRFEHSFDYTFEIDERINSEQEMVPPLILQPYVENAIWHGLLHKEGNRNLEVILQSQVNGITAIIRDNGIGRDAAMSMKSKSATKHKSLGMAITADRINKVQEGLGSEGVQIVDLKNEDGTAVGTEVTIHLPTINDTL